MSQDKYEVELDRIISKENPEYYNQLKIILKEFQEHLISSGVIKNGDYSSYHKLLKQIQSGNKKDFNITYNIGDSLKLLNNDRFQKTLINNIRLLNHNESKSSLFQKKLSELKKIKKKFNCSDFAKLLLDIYEKDDYDLPLVRLKLFKFLDPNTDSIIYIFAGKPNPE